MTAPSDARAVVRYSPTLADQFYGMSGVPVEQRKVARMEPDRDGGYVEHDDYAALRERAEKAEAEVARLRKDAERLTHLTELTGISAYGVTELHGPRACDDPATGFQIVSSTKVVGNGATLRAAIDAAMQESK